MAFGFLEGALQRKSEFDERKKQENAAKNLVKKVDIGLNKGKSWESISKDTGVPLSLVKQYSQQTRPGYGIKKPEDNRNLLQKTGDFLEESNKAFMGSALGGLADATTFATGKLTGVSDKDIAAAQKDVRSSIGVGDSQGLTPLEKFGKTPEQIRQEIIKNRTDFASRAGRVVGAGQGIIADVATTIAPAAAAEKVLRGTQIANRFLQGGKLAKVAGEAGISVGSGAAATAASILKDPTQLTAENVGTNTAIDAALGAATPFIAPAIKAVRGIGKKGVADGAETLSKAAQESKAYKAYKDAENSIGSFKVSKLQKVMDTARREAFDRNNYFVRADRFEAKQAGRSLDDQRAAGESITDLVGKFHAIDSMSEIQLNKKFGKYSIADFIKKDGVDTPAAVSRNQFMNDMFDQEVRNINRNKKGIATKMINRNVDDAALAQRINEYKMTHDDWADSLKVSKGLMDDFLDTGVAHKILNKDVAEFVKKRYKTAAPIERLFDDEVIRPEIRGGVQTNLGRDKILQSLEGSDAPVNLGYDRFLNRTRTAMLETVKNDLSREIRRRGEAKTLIGGYKTLISPEKTMRFEALKNLRDQANASMKTAKSQLSKKTGQLRVQNAFTAPLRREASKLTREVLAGSDDEAVRAAAENLTDKQALNRQQRQALTEGGYFGLGKNDGIPKELHSLADEARKYKSADEFVKANYVAHGTPNKIEGNIRPSSGWYGKATYLTDDITGASGRGGGQNIYFVEKPKGKLLDIKAHGSKDNTSFTPKQYQDAIDNGYDGLRIKHDNGKTWYAMFKEQPAKTKQQLTDLYNQAHSAPQVTKTPVQKPKPVDPTAALKQEALKYKSAEEFVNSHSPVYHGTNADLKDISQLQSGRQRGEYSNGTRSIFASENPNLASKYGKNVLEGRNTGKVLDTTKLGDPHDPNKLVVPKEFSDYTTNPILDSTDRRVLENSYFKGGTPSNIIIDHRPNIQEYFRSKGYSAIQIPRGSDVNGPATEMSIIDHGKIKSRQQLTDLYNQAHTEAKTAAPKVEAPKSAPIEKTMRFEALIRREASKLTREVLAGSDDEAVRAAAENLTDKQALDIFTHITGDAGVDALRGKIIKSKAGQQTQNLLDEITGLKEQYAQAKSQSQEAFGGMVDNRQANATNVNQVAGFEQGYKFKGEINPQLAKALEQVSSGKSREVLKALNIPSASLKLFWTVANPIFNALRTVYEPVLMGITSKANPLDLVDPRTIKLAFSKQFGKDIYSSGAIREGVTSTARDTQSSARAIAAQVLPTNKRNIANIIDFATKDPKTAASKVSEVMSLYSNALRRWSSAGTYRRFLRQYNDEGKALNVAVHDYNEVLGNFQRASDSARAIEAVLPYTVAGQVGVRQLGKAARERPKETAARLLAFMGAVTMGANSLMDTPEGQEYAKEQYETERSLNVDGYITIPLPGGPKRNVDKNGKVTWDNIIKIKIPPDFRAETGLINRAMLGAKTGDWSHLDLGLAASSAFGAATGGLLVDPNTGKVDVGKAIAGGPAGLAAIASGVNPETGKLLSDNKKSSDNAKRMSEILGKTVSPQQIDALFSRMGTVGSSARQNDVGTIIESLKNQTIRTKSKSPRSVWQEDATKVSDGKEQINERVNELIRKSGGNEGKELAQADKIAYDFNQKVDKLLKRAKSNKDLSMLSKKQIGWLEGLKFPMEGKYIKQSSIDSRLE